MCRAHRFLIRGREGGRGEKCARLFKLTTWLFAEVAAGEEYHNRNTWELLPDKTGMLFF
jgi:hypothetical protein